MIHFINELKQQQGKLANNNEEKTMKEMRLGRNYF
jgi:hypothetical protein